MRTVMIATALLGIATTDAALAGAAKRHRVVHAAAARPAALPDTYRRPTRGWALPAYWQSPRFAVADWRALGLREPLPGYRWTRYHGDAVLVDRNYSIFDVALAVDRRGSDPFYANDDRVYAGTADRHDVAPPAPVAPRRPRLRPQPPAAMPPEPVYDADEPPIAPDRMPPPPADHADDDWVSPDGRTVVTSRGDVRYDGGSVTTVTIGNPVTTTTTTTTETYDAPVRARRVQRSQIYRARRW
ncbi:RcnB family protein [Sphingomonas sp. Tas61C01]|uniref:RcnB family protein n=1 Tax=Sphingomonas sp. Tas61C01 TaxID=3458297 RepID=UPI00403EA172